MTELFDRRAEVQIGSTVILKPEDRFSLRTAFEVFRSLKPEPNTATLRVWGLAQDTRAEFEELDKAPCIIGAGYVDNVHEIFSGDLRTAITEDDGPVDKVTIFESGDGESAWGKARINKTLPPGESIQSGLKAIAKTLGVGAGNSSEAALLAFSKGVDPWSTGALLSGSAAREMTDFCTSFGFEWSIQNGQLQILEEGKPLLGTAYEISEDSGMLGSPTVDKDGVLSIVVQMIPDITPGKLILVNAARITGAVFRCVECRYVGDTAQDSSDWFIEIQGERL